MTFLPATGLALRSLPRQVARRSGREEIRAYQVYLTEEKKLSPRSITIAVSVLRLLYKVTLRREWNLEEVFAVPKQPQKLLVILSPEEVLEFLACVRGSNHRTILTCCYAAGCASRKSSLSRLATLTVDK